ncbi:MAG TPA: DUF222 domain-containing protein [Steroidobacteraceae bacterium]|nr:DUF222 domain-containing protein [Steroidobacteraceae bacterium]
MPDLMNEICSLAGRINAANHRFLTLIAEFDERKGWSDGATQSCAHWLNWKCGIALGAAREKVRVATALAKLPKISAAMESGAISYSKVREITRVASAESEAYLLEIAECGTASHVEKLVRAYRRCKEVEELSREERQQQGRSVGYRFDDDGSLIMTCRLPAVAGAKLRKAIDLAVEELPVEPPPDVPAGTLPTRVPFHVRRADALGMIVESFLARGAQDASGTDQHQIVVHVAAETLRDRKAGCCEVEDGPSLAAETARRFACDASVVELVEDEDGEPLSSGRKRRTISAPLRRALQSRDKGCKFPGCCNKRWVDAHHIVHWANGGETKPSNLVSVCRFHHRAVHEGGYRIERLDDGALRFVRPGGNPVGETCTQPPGDRHQMPDGEMVNRWRGERMDLAHALDVLYGAGRRARNVPAGTSAGSTQV